MTTVDRRNDPNITWAGRVIWGRNPSGTFTAAGVDNNGNLNVNIQASSDSGMTVSTASVQQSSATPSTLISAGAAGIYNDIASMAVTNESSTATVVSLIDGSGTTFKFALAANGGISYNPALPLPQALPATAWTVSNSASVTCDFVVIYIPSTTPS